MASLRTLGVLEAAVESGTDYGGKSRTWDQVAALWLDLKPTGFREAGDGGGKPALTERAQAQARYLAAAQPGQRLQAGGQAWRVVSIEPHRPQPGRMTLNLERTWP